MTQNELKRYLHYDIDTGFFTWLVNSSNVKEGAIAGCINPSGYRVIRINRHLYRAHRLAFLYMTGCFPENDTDHINGSRDDNRWCNLRAVSRSENSRNTKIHKDNTSGVIGISRVDKRSVWDVRVMENSKTLSRYFSDSKFGGINLALMAASFYAVKLRNKIGYHENHGRIA